VSDLKYVGVVQGRSSSRHLLAAQQSAILVGHSFWWQYLESDEAIEIGITSLAHIPDAALEMGDRLANHDRGANRNRDGIASKSKLQSSRKPKLETRNPPGSIERTRERTSCNRSPVVRRLGLNESDKRHHDGHKHF